MSKKDKWNEAYQNADFESASPARVLSENEYLLPKEGKVLDLACGRAGNALFLAKKYQYDIDVIDYSSVVIDALKSFVTKKSLSMNCILRDVEKDGLQNINSDTQYNIIIVSYFLNRKLFPQIVKALKPNGLLFYQTWSQVKIDNSGPSNAKFRLEQGELLRLCNDLKPIVYREDCVNGDLTKGLRNEAMIVAQKP